MANGDGPNKPNRPVRPRQGNPQAGRKRRVVIDTGAGRPRQDSRQRRDDTPRQPKQPREIVPQTGPVTVESGITVQNLSQALGQKVPEIIKILMKIGAPKTVTQSLTDDEVELIAAEIDREITIRHAADEEDILEEFEDAPEDLVDRPPVVTIMGHVDHGKTTLLDAIRSARVVETEAGGITQHIGAYQVDQKGRKITFIDTPGHEAFTEMRARGAKVTDIAVLVVAADDGVMPQTKESISHAKAAQVPIVVAINKIDVPNANQDRVMGELAERGLTRESWGGETVTVPVSAKTGEGLDELLENILVVAELEDLKANPNAPASGYAIEGERDPGRGPVATLLLNRGTLHKGDVVLAGTAYGRVRAMLDYTGQRVKDAGPGDPAEILGLSGVPEAGTRFEVVDHERIARDRAQQAEAAFRRQELAEQGGSRRTLEELLGE